MAEANQVDRAGTAQRFEQRTHNSLAGGSNPSARTIFQLILGCIAFERVRRVHYFHSFFSPFNDYDALQLCELFLMLYNTQQNTM